MLNNISFKKFAIISLSLFLAFNGSVLLDNLNLAIPLVRQISGFLFLTFIPGYTILRILKIHRTDWVESLLFAVGLSLFYIMSIGFIANTFLPAIGIKKPISLKPLLVIFNIAILFLLSLAYFKDKNDHTYNNIELEIKDLLNKHTLALSLIPILAIFGGYVFNFYNTSVLIVITFLLISLIPVIILHTDTRHYCYLIWILSLSLLYLSSLGVSWNYIWGYDINHEYYIANLVLTNGYWDSLLYSNVNAMLSIAMLNPIYTILLGISPVIIFKVIYPFLFSFVPVALYKSYKNILNERESFLAAFFFISLHTFFTEMLALARQQIAELYLALIVLLVFSNIERNIKYTLLLLFSFSLVVSHYGTTYLFLLSLILANIVFYVIYRKDKQPFLIRVEYTALFYVMVFLWYTLTSSSSPFDTIVRTGNIILANIYDLFDPYKSQGLYTIVKNYSGLRQFTKYYILLSQMMIAIGILWLALNLKRVKFNREFIALALVWFIFDVYGIALPYFSNALNATRLYQLTLFFLSPFVVIGFSVIVKSLSKFIQFKLSVKIVARSLASFLAVYLIITSGVLLYVAKDQLYPPYFDKKVPAPRWTNEEIISGLWMKEHKGSYSIYGDNNAILLFLGLIGQPISSHNFRLDWSGSIIQPKSSTKGYLFLNEWNIKNKKIQALLPTIVDREYIDFNNPNLKKFLDDKIYTSQAAEYYLKE